MTVFYLPDLGEGLPDAEIRNWHVQIGDLIKTDEPMVSVETAKAIVDIPAPFSGKVVQLYGQAGDIIKTGGALVDIAEDSRTPKNPDMASVVGHLPAHDSAAAVERIIATEPSAQPNARPSGIKATPSVRALASKMRIDLDHCIGTGPSGQILVSDLMSAAHGKRNTVETRPNPQAMDDYQPLRGTRRTMATAMSKSHQAVVPVTLVDDADVYLWPEKTDITLRLIRAIMAACQREPRLNAWFDDAALSLQQHQHINLGIAMDAPEGLFVPVLKNVVQRNAADLRKTIDRFKLDLKSRRLASEEFTDATFVLSNIGIFAGRYANPIVIPPMVAILAVGRMRDAVVAYQEKPALHKLLPLSLTVDHRVITGGEAARFLSALIRDLETS